MSLNGSDRNDLTAAWVRSLVAQACPDPNGATVPEAVGTVEELTPDDHPLVETARDDEADTKGYPTKSNGIELVG